MTRFILFAIITSEEGMQKQAFGFRPNVVIIPGDIITSEEEN